MKLEELFDLSGVAKNVERLKKNAKRQASIAKAAQARLRVMKARQVLNTLNQS